MKNFSDFFVFLRVTVDELRLTEKKEERKKEEEEEEQNGCFCAGISRQNKMPRELRG